MGQVNVILPDAPDTYNKQQLDDLVRQLRLALRQINNPGPIQCSTIVITDLPTSSAGLPAGSVWNDAGTLKIV